MRFGNAHVFNLFVDDLLSAPFPGTQTAVNSTTNAACDFSSMAKKTSLPETVPGLCPGDSGGPVYSESEPFAVVGVNANYHPTGVSKFVRVDAGASALQNWVKGAMK